MIVAFNCKKINNIIKIPGSKGLNPHELAHRWVNDQDIISLITMNCEAQE